MESTIQATIIVGKGDNFELAVMALEEELSNLFMITERIHSISSPTWKGWEHSKGDEGYLVVSVLAVYKD